MTVTYLERACPSCNATSPSVTRKGDVAVTHCCNASICPMCGGSGSLNGVCDVCGGKGYK